MTFMQPIIFPAAPLDAEAAGVRVGGEAAAPSIAAPFRSGTAWTMALGLALAFGVLAWAGIFLTREAGRIAAVWVANGAAVAILLRSPRAFAPLLLGGVLMGNLAANLLHADPLSRALLLAAGNQVEILCTVLVMRPVLGSHTPFDNGPVIGRFMAAALFGAAASGLLVAGALGLSEGVAVLATASHWFVADLLGLLVVGPLLLSLPADPARWFEPRPAPPLARRLEGGALAIGVIAATLYLFFQQQAPLLFVIGPLLLLCAFRLTLPASCTLILAASAIALGATFAGFGPVAALAGEPMMQLFALQALIASMIALVLPVRALIAERDRLGDAAHRSETKFRRIAEASISGIMHIDPVGRPTWANTRWSEMTGIVPTIAPAPERWLEIVAPEARGQLMTLWAEVRATHLPVKGEFHAHLCSSRHDQVEASTPPQRSEVPEDEGEETPQFLSLSIHPELRADGGPNGFVVRITDITARRLAEARLAESELRYRLITENVSDIVLRLARDGTILFASSASERVLGYRPGMLRGRRLRDLVHGEDWPEFRAAFQDLLSTGEEQATLRYRQRSADGRFRWVEGSFRPLFDEATGAPIELVASIRDINRRMRTEAVVAESAAKLRESHRLITLAEGLAKVGHWRLGLDEAGFDYSIEINRIAGVPRREALGARSALRTLVSEDRRVLLATLARARRAERACECEVRLERDGEQRIVRVVIQGDRAADGRLTGLVGVVRDVTEARRARDELVQARDRAKAAAEAKAHFLATMSHEIRTPMTGVLGMIDLLMKNPDEADRSRYLDMLKTSADLLMAVLDDILDFSKIDNGQIRLEKRPFALDRTLAQSAALFERRAAEKGLRLEFRYHRQDEDGGAPCVVVGDDMRLRQVIANLLSNAIKFSAVGEVRLGLETWREGADTRVRIAVTDEGIGIDPTLHDQLFDPFVQADASTSRRFGGTGLGLAICRRLVEAMGGAIALDSKPGKGARFTIELVLRGASLPAGDPASDKASAMARSPYVPRDAMLGVPRIAPATDGNGKPGSDEAGGCVPAQDARPGKPTSRSESEEDAPRDWAAGIDEPACDPLESPRGRGALRLLVAEDNPVNQMLIGAMLRADGHVVTAVENGRLALEAAKAERFDAIVMDMQMPEMDGLAATRAIRASGGPCAAIPILALTADASPERRRFYDGAGLSAFLTKPIDQDLLLDQLRAIAGLGALDGLTGELGSPGEGASHAGADADAARDPGGGEASTREQGGGASPHFGGPLPSLIDRDQHRALREAVGEARFQEMLALLDRELAREPRAIADAVATGDVKTALAIAHGLKGAAGSAGASAVAALAARFESESPSLASLSGRLCEVAKRTRAAIAVLADDQERRASG